MNYIYDTFIKKTEILSKALEKATERTRTMLYVVTFFSLVIIVTAFNAYLSWDRKLNANERLLLAEELNLVPASSLKPYNHLLVDKLNACGQDISYDQMDKHTAKEIKHYQNFSDTNPCIQIALDDYTEKLRANGLILSQTDYFKVFLERQKFTIPIIGLSCYADDVYLIGGFGLLILLTYSFFSVRRENRIVQRIAKSIDYVSEKDPKDYLHNHEYSDNEIALIRHNLLEYIFFGCVEFFIFNTGLVKTDITSNSPKSNNSKSIDDSNTSGRFVLNLLYYLPIIAMCFAFLFEITSLIMRFKYISNWDKTELTIRYIFTGLFLAAIIWQISWIKKLNQENSELIDKMYKKIIDSREKLGLE